MAEHLTNHQILRYHMRALETDELIGLDDHLTVCAECRVALNAGGQGKDKFASLRKDLDATPSTGHLDDEQLAAYADGALKAVEAEIVENHMAVCSKCELLASDLVVFRDQIAADLNTKYAPPVENPRLTTYQTDLQPSPSFWKSMFGRPSPALAFGMGALAMLVVAGFIWLIVRANRTGPTDTRVEQTPSPAPITTVPPVNGAQPGASPLASPSPSPQVLLALNDGSKQVGIDANGNLTGMDDLAPAYRDIVKTALITQQAANLAALSGIGGQQGELRGGQNQGPGFAPLSPLGKVIFEAKPTLRWSKLDGATDYRVEIYDSSFSLVAASPPLVMNSWELPNALERGQIYSWQVIATKDGEKIKTPIPPAPEAKFKVLDQKRADDLTIARKHIPISHLTLGVLYAQAGMLNEAEREFTALLHDNPQSDVAKKLLDNIQATKKTTK